MSFGAGVNVDAGNVQTLIALVKFSSGFKCVCEFLLINNEHASSWQVEELKPDSNNAASAAFAGSQTTFLLYGTAATFFCYIHQVLCERDVRSL